MIKIKKPVGALGIGKATVLIEKEAPIYLVKLDTGEMWKRTHKRRQYDLPREWFFDDEIEPRIGFAFDNYFHAYAFTLKLREIIKEQEAQDKERYEDILQEFERDKKLRQQKLAKRRAKYKHDKQKSRRKVPGA